MDPISAVGLLSSVISIAQLVTHAARRLSMLKTKYRQADLTVSLLIGQLCTMEAALNQLAEFQQPDSVRLAASRSDMQTALSTSIDGCRFLIQSLDERLDQLEEQAQGRLSAWGRWLLLWNEHDIKCFLDLLDRQVNALNLLLQAIQCQSLTEQRSLMEDEVALTTLRLARECTESLHAQEDKSSRLNRMSIASRPVSNLSVIFDFDSEILGSRVYHTATKSNLQDLLNHSSNDRPLSFGAPTEETAETQVVGYHNIGQNQTRQNLDWPLPKAMIAARRQPEVKALILGARESGKTTLLKSMRLYCQKNYTRDEREFFREIIFSNVTQGMRAILMTMKSLRLRFGDENLETHARNILGQPEEIERKVLSADVATAIKALWADKGVQEAYKRCTELSLHIAAQYYADQIDRLANEWYIPTDQDILLSRLQTIGINETILSGSNGAIWHVFDFGGVSSQRKVWAPCFENVSLVLFTVNISEYDNVYSGYEGLSRMQESLTLWDFIVNGEWSQNTHFVLLFTKMDKFRSMVPVLPLQQFFPDYEGGSSPEAAKDYIKERFVSLNSHNRSVQVRFVSVFDGELSMAKAAIDAATRVPKLRP